jgi:hypothetical protein
MKIFRTRAVFLRAVVSVALSVGVVLAAAAVASAATVAHFTPKHVIEAQLHSSITQKQSAALPASSTFTHFTATVNVGGTNYTYTIAGKNPAVHVTNATANIKSIIVPVVIKFPGTPDKWDPTMKDSCDAGASALNRTKASPLFVAQPTTWGGTSIGTQQLTSAFQRAEFWTDAQPSGVNPTYALKLAAKTLPKVTINVPLADAAVATTSCGNKLLGAVDINWLDPYIQNTLIPSLASEGVNDTTVPIFLLHNVVEYQGSTSNCCILGYHNAYGASPFQTYGLAMYDNSGDFSGSSDISVLTHEIAEWANDPFVNNPTPAWGHIGQVSGCQANLEVGDPLSGTTFADTVGGFTYHPQELAFFSWFYHQSPSLGVNGWYSDQGTFRSFAAACS